MDTQVVEGVRYSHVGTGGAHAPTYLLIHGLAGSLEQWTDVADQLALSDCQVYSVDIPGFGGTTLRSQDFDLEESIRLLGRFVTAMDLQRVVIVSHSISFVVAARLAAIDPERYGRIVFVSGALIRASEIAQQPLKALLHPRVGGYVAIQFMAGMARVPHSLLELVANHASLRALTLWPFVADPRSLAPDRIVRLLARSGSSAVLGVLFTAAKIDYIAALRDLPRPVDIIWGSRDPLIGQYDLRQMHMLAPIDREVAISDCGHWPWIEAISPLVEFLKEAPGESRAYSDG